MLPLPEVQTLLQQKRECHRRFCHWTSHEPLLSIMMIVAAYHVIAAIMYPPLSGAFWISAVSMTCVNVCYISKYLVVQGTMVFRVSWILTLLILLIQVNTTMYLFCRSWYYAYVMTMAILYLIHQSVTLHLYYEYYLIKRTIAYLHRGWWLVE